MPDETYYSVLEIPETANASEIKSAYYRLIREVHPDRLANAPVYWQRQAEEKAKEINEAFAVLSDPGKRRIYDTQLSAFRRSQGSSNPASAPQGPGPSDTGGPAKQPPRSTTNSQRGPTTAQGSSTGAGPSQQPSPRPQPSPSRGPASATSHVLLGMTAGQRLFFAGLFALFGVPAAVDFLGTASDGDEAGYFLVALVLLAAIAYLYRRNVGRLFAHIGIRQPDHQMWATWGIIAFALIAGRAVIASPSRSSTQNQQTSTTPPNTSGQSGGVTEGWAPAPNGNGPDAGMPRKGAPASSTRQGDAAGGASASRRTTALPVPSLVDSILRPSVIRSESRATPQAENNSIAQRPSTRLLAASPPTAAPTSSDEVPSQSAAPSATDQASIQAACAGAYYEGPAAFHQCQADKLRELANYPYPPDLSGLSQADRNSVQAACAGAFYEGPAAYHQCQADKLKELTRHPDAPDLSGLSQVDRNSVLAACAGAYYEGPGTYHQCQADRLKELSNYPDAPNLGGLPQADRDSIQAACAGAYYEGPAAYHRCLWDQIHALGNQ